MKVFLSFSLLLLVFFSAFSQDRIITKKGDTIDCKINRVSAEYIHYLIQQESIRSRIPLSEVESYFIAEKPSTEEDDPSEEIIEQEIPSSSPQIFKDDLNPAEGLVRVSLTTGYSYQFGGYENHPDDYAKKLRSLWNFEGNIHYYTTQNFGVGVKFIQTFTPVTQDEVVFGTDTIRNIDEDVKFTFFGLSILNRQNAISSRDAFYYGVALGIMSYNDSGTIDGFPFVEEGETLGIILEVAYDYMIKKGLAIGVNAGVNFATLRDFSVNNVQASTFLADPTFNISQLNFGIGVKYIR